MEHPPDVGGGRGVSDESRISRQGQLRLPEPLREQVLAGAIGLKLHEDWGTTPAAIDTCLTSPTSSMSRWPSTPTRSTKPASSKARSRLQGPHHPHLSLRRRRRRPRAGHHPRLRRGERAAVVHQSHAALHRQHHRRASRHAHGLPSPRFTQDPRGRRLRRERIRPETIAAEDLLHDLGAISMMSSDSQAMGRIGETITRTWQTAHKMKVQFGKLEGPSHPQSRQFPRAALRFEIHDQSRASPRHRA
jgi:urease subunit alpha